LAGWDDECQHRAAGGSWDREDRTSGCSRESTQEREGDPGRRSLTATSQHARDDSARQANEEPDCKPSSCRSVHRSASWLLVDRRHAALDRAARYPQRGPPSRKAVADANEPPRAVCYWRP
jgi:hypothetical protein